MPPVSGSAKPISLAGKTVTINMSTKEFADFVNAHESWHCLDIRYMRDTGDGLEGAVKQNRAEMFADIGGVMEGIRNGADLTLIDKAAALHATWTFLTGPAHAKTPRGERQAFCKHRLRHAGRPLCAESAHRENGHRQLSQARPRAVARA